MKNMLFIVCPFSCMESALRKEFGSDSYFVTAPGAILEIEDSKYMESIIDFMLSKKITALYVVNDTACKFLNRIIKREEIFGLAAEVILEELYFDYYTTYFKRQPLHEQQIRLAELSIKKQVAELKRSEILGEFIHEHKIQVKALITTKTKNTFEEIVLDTLDNTIYEY